MELFGKKITKNELLKRVGDISQIGGIRLMELQEGREKGVNAAEMRSGSGFRAVILLSRGIDIGYAEYKGMPLCWRSSVKDAHPAFFEPEEKGWLRTFYGGMMVTCGLTYLGSPCEDNGKQLGLHGRISATPATNVCTEEEWQDDDYVLTLKGKIRETAVFGDNISLSRKITMKLGENKLTLHDIVENMGHKETEHMILYHVNIGFPVLDEGSEMLSPTVNAVPSDEEAEKGKEDFNKFNAPTAGFREKCYDHKVKADKNGFVHSAIVNRKLNNGEGLGLYIKYPAAELPFLVEWKMTSEGIYVVGTEPANCFITGRAKARANGTLQFLKPGEKREYHLEIGVLSSKNEISEFEKKIKI
jgi:hypothetical protein